MTDFVEHNDVEHLMASLAQAVAEDLRAALDKNGTASISIPGGTTPAPFFDILCQQDLDWSGVKVLLSDERYVPEDSPRSNTSLVKRHLMQDKAAAAQLVAFYEASLSEDEFVAQSGASMNAFLPLDVSVLGMGADMHTASLFPDSAELADALSSDMPLHVVRPESQPEARITLSGPVLAKAGKTYVLIVGQNKRTAYDQACSENSALVAPIRTVFGENTKVFWADKA
jgi:6-phosphogluconolactonase